MESCPSRGTWIEMADYEIKEGFTAWSCPSRGTWIEICAIQQRRFPRRLSCPSRGTWIEIMVVIYNGERVKVVPLAGHVD